MKRWPGTGRCRWMIALSSTARRSAFVSTAPSSCARCDCTVDFSLGDPEGASRSPLVKMHDPYITDRCRHSRLAHEKQHRLLRKRQKRALDTVLRLPLRRSVPAAKQTPRLVLGFDAKRFTLGGGSRQVLPRASNSPNRTTSGRTWSDSFTRPPPKPRSGSHWTHLPRSTTAGLS